MPPEWGVDMKHYEEIVGLPEWGEIEKKFHHEEQGGQPGGPAK